MHKGPEDDRDPVLQRLFAEGLRPLSNGAFTAMLERRLRLRRRVRRLCHAIAVATAVAALAAVAPGLIEASVMMSAYLGGASIHVGDAAEVPLIWILSGVGGALVLVLSRRGLQR